MILLISFRKLWKCWFSMIKLAQINYFGLQHPNRMKEACYNLEMAGYYTIMPRNWLFCWHETLENYNYFDNKVSLSQLNFRLNIKKYSKSLEPKYSRKSDKCKNWIFLHRIRFLPAQLKRQSHQKVDWIVPRFEGCDCTAFSQFLLFQHFFSLRQFIGGPEWSNQLFI